MDGDASFGAWLRRRRKALDLTQDALAARVGCSAATIRKIEVDARRPSRQIAALLADALDIPATDHPTFLRVARGERRIERLADVVPPMHRSAERPTPVPPSRLPIPLTPLIGRETELAEVGHLLTRTECRLLTLVGPGGMGKTRLAIAAAAEQGDAFPDGVFFVALAPLTAPEFIVPAIAEAIGFAFFGLMEPKTQLLNYVREKEMLLVLDNVEQLLDGAGLLSELLQYAPAVKVLVTSRERLQLQGEWVVDLQGLPFPPPLSHMAEMSTLARGQGRAEVDSYDAVTLFVTSAQRIRMGFALSEQNQVDVARVCRLVEGLPLGIELAATWVPTLSCQEIAHQIERNIDFLAVSIRDLPERHRSIRAVFDHSWNLLALEERQVLQRLSVFRGGFTREAAEPVAGASVGVMSALVAKSLVHRTKAGRYDMHELVRQYAGEQLQAAGEIEQTQGRHLAFFLALTEAAEPELRGAQQAVWLDRLEREHDNVRVALAWSQAAVDGAQMGLRLAGALWLFWFLRGHLSEGRACLAGLLARPEVNEPTVAHAKALYVAGHLAAAQNDFALARMLLGESLALGDKHAIAYARNGLGFVAWLQGDYAAARVLYEESLAMFQDLGNTWDIASALFRLGDIDLYLGDYARAAVSLEESLALARQVGDNVVLGHVLLSLGYAARLEGDDARAAACYEESLARFRALGHTWGIAAVLHALGYVLRAQGDNVRAAACFSESLTRYWNMGHREGTSLDLTGLAGVAGEMGQPVQAARLFGAAEVLREAIGLSRQSDERVAYDRNVAGVRAQIDAAAFAAAWAEGHAMPLQQAIIEALGLDIFKPPDNRSVR